MTTQRTQPLTMADLADKATINVHPELSSLLGVSKNAAYAAVHDGTIPSLKLGRRLLVPTAQLRRLLGEDVPA